MPPYSHCLSHCPSPRLFQAPYHRRCPLQYRPVPDRCQSLPHCRQSPTPPGYRRGQIVARRRLPQQGQHAEAPPGLARLALARQSHCQPAPEVRWGDLAGGLELASRCTGAAGAGRGARSWAGGCLARWVGVTGAGFGRVSTCFGGASTCLGSMTGGDSGGVAGTGSGIGSTSGMRTGSGGDSSGAGGVGSGMDVTAIGTGESGSGRGQGSRHACQPADSTARPATCSMRAVRKGKKKCVDITRLVSFQT